MTDMRILKSVKGPWQSASTALDMFDAFVAKFCAEAKEQHVNPADPFLEYVRETLYLECARIFDQHQTCLSDISWRKPIPPTLT